MAVTLFASWALTHAAPDAPVAAKEPRPVLDIRDFGAIGDGKTLCTYSDSEGDRRLHGPGGARSACRRASGGRARSIWKAT